MISDEEIKTAIELITINSDEFVDRFPAANSENNFYLKTENTDWTEGFWTGELWLSYEYSKNEKLRDIALVQVENFLHRIKNHINTDHHDICSASFP